MAPGSRNKSSNPIQRLLETEEKGRGLALFGWAGVTVFAFLAAFASWQFAPARAVSQRLAHLDEASAGDITGGIKPATRSAPGRVPTIAAPTPLPDDPSISKDDVDQIRADLKDLRRMVGRIDVSTDVLARRISNLEDSIATGPSASVKPAPKPLQAITPLATSPAPAAVTPAPAVSANPVVPAASANPVSATPPAAPASPSTVAVVAPQPSASAPQIPPQPRAPGVPPRPLPEQGDKSPFDRNAVDRSQLERMLMQRAQGLESDSSEANTYIPPLPDPISVVPKSHPMVLPPQPAPNLPPAMPAAKTEPKPPQDVPTTGSVQPKPAAAPPVMPPPVIAPIDPTKAVVVKPPEIVKTVPAAAELSPEDQKKASETMALALREEQNAAKPAAPAPASQPIGIDLGGYRSISQVKKVWSDLEMRQGKLTKVLIPLARLSEATDGVEIRLVAGPFIDKEQAVRTCRQLRGATAKCDAVAYAGESILTKPAPEAERRPASSPEFVRRPPLKLDLPTKPTPPSDPSAPRP